MKAEAYMALIQQKRPTLKPISARTYAMSLKAIEPPDATSTGWVNSPEYTLPQLERYKPNTRKNTLNALIVVCENKACAIYSKHRDKYNDQYADLG